MGKKITIEVEDDELELIELIGAVLDFGGYGYDDDNQPGDRESQEIYEGFVEKLKKAMKGTT